MRMTIVVDGDGRGSDEDSIGKLLCLIQQL